MPTILLSGRRKGWLYARARVTCGGVARSNGDFWCTRMVLLLFAADAVLGVAELRVVGEKVAYVGLGPPEGVAETSWDGWWEVESSGSLRCDRGVDM
jgi:hypothetical protein